MSTRDPVLSALRRNLENSDPLSQADKVKRIQARIDKLEKAADSKPEPASKSVTTTTTTVSNLAAPNKGKK